MNIQFYLNQDSRRTPWSAAKPILAPVAPGAEGTLARCLMLRSLEIPVGNFITSTKGEKEIPSIIQDILVKNIADEARHDEALNLLWGAYKDKLPCTKADEDFARGLTNDWVSHPDHPLVKAAVLESSVFFVILPLFRFLGQTGFTEVSRYISGDEVIHVSVNRQLAMDLGYTWSPSLDRLRERTIKFILGKFTSNPLEGDSKWANHADWINRSRNLLNKGVAQGMEDSKMAVATAFFEVGNNSLPTY
jgi:hypothetical protein